MPVSIVKLIESFGLGLPLPVPTEELPPHVTEQDARNLTEHYLLARLHQLRSKVVRDMSDQGDEGVLGKKVLAIVTKPPSERTPDEASFLVDTLEKVEGNVYEYADLVFDMYYGTKSVFDAEEAREDLQNHFYGKRQNFRPDAPTCLIDLICNPQGFFRYYTGLTEKEGECEFMEKIDYYSNLISKIWEAQHEYHGLGNASHVSAGYSRDHSQLKERRILKEYVDRYLPGPKLCNIY